jgi:hypothetical protein
LLIVGLLLSLIFFISPVKPVYWTPDPDPKLTGAFAPNNKLFNMRDAQVQQLFLQGVGKGPEDIIIGNDGFLYTGYEDGRIVRVLAADIIDAFNDPRVRIEHQEYVNTGGRPLGLRFDEDNNLIVADAVKGLLKIDKQRNIHVLVDEFENKRLMFVDHLDIAKDGTIWFSDASSKFSMHNYVYDFLEASATGRLLSYNPATNETKVRMDNLFFANGVALGPNDEFVLINETGIAKIHRLWLTGKKAGLRDIFIEHLPAMPDNLYFKDEIFWIALPVLRDPLIEGLAQNTLARRMLAGLPKTLLKASSQYGFVLGITPQGQIIHNLQSASGYHSVTGATEFEGYLFLGSLANSSIAVVKL